MRLAVVSDIHDQIWKLAAALDAVRSADALLCLGDLCSPFVVHQLGRGFPGPIHILFGNNDGDPFRITMNARNYKHIRIHAEFLKGEFGARKVAAVHYDNIGRALAASGEFDLVTFGHNHVYEVGRAGRTLLVNPGPIMGCAFAPDGTPRAVPSSYVVYDTESGEACGYDLVADGEAYKAQQREAVPTGA